MGLGDKISNKAEELKGRAKEAIGRITGDPGLETEGRRDQGKATVKKVGENVKDAIRDVRRKFT